MRALAMLVQVERRAKSVEGGEFAGVTAGVWVNSSVGNVVAIGGISASLMKSVVVAKVLAER